MDYLPPPYEIADRLSAQVAQVLATPDPTLAALVEGITLDSTAPVFPEEPGNMVGSRLTYTITYSADPVDPDNAI